MANATLRPFGADAEGSWRFFRQLLDASPDGVAVVRDLKFIYVNPAGCALLGYARQEDLLDLRLTDVLTDACRDAVAQIARDRARGLPVPSRYEVEYRRRDGSAGQLQKSTTWQSHRVSPGNYAS